MSRFIDIARSRIAEKKRLRDQQVNRVIDSKKRFIDIAKPLIAEKKRAKLKQLNKQLNRDQSILNDIMEDLGDSVGDDRYRDANADGYMDLHCYSTTWEHLRGMTSTLSDKLTQRLKAQGVSGFELVVVDCINRVRLYYADE